ncbi:centrosomal protein of 63 kDa isoform X1 [Xiphophorus maculatus]|uniref:centrosomal protein of 63 kDa isoform X1 n=1 Tax=Xiphophorus maculatus TaxID=8083 RepID=UPI000C6CEC8C|nr:centrosomal protein of 63 kDa isoform X1 [Xiphophorus maculatus]
MEASLDSTRNTNFSSVLSSCEPELQELMKQIDIMISHQRREWQVEKHFLEVRVKNGEEGLLTSKNIIERRDLEIGVLQKQLEEILRSRQEAVAKYEQQLQKLREELDLLKGSYQKLQRKQLKQTSGGAKESDQLKEYQRLSAEWEQQRAQYQKQLTTLEAENKSLTEEISHIKSAPWRVEQEHMECCSEVQHLGALLEKARSSLLSQEMELERLRPCEALLGASQPQQLRSDEPDASRGPDQDQQRRGNEAVRLRQLLHAKDQVIRSLEDCLAAQGCTGVEVIRKDLEKMADKLQGARAGEANLRAEVTCLKQRMESMSRQLKDQTKVEKELRNVAADFDNSVAESKKVSVRSFCFVFLFFPTASVWSRPSHVRSRPPPPQLREELETARQTHSAEVEGVRREVSKLTGELHQRDVSISALSGSSASIQQQLRGEVQRAAEAATQLKMTQAQLETLQAENKQLKGLLQTLQSHSPKGDESSAALLQQRYLTSISSLEEENRQLRQALAKHHVQLDAQDETGPERNQHVELSHTTMTAQVDPGPERTQPASYDRKIQKIQRLFKELQDFPKSSNEPPGREHKDSQLHSSSSSSSSTSSPGLSRGSSATALTPHRLAAEGQNSGPENCLTSRSRGPEEALSPTRSAVSRFLAEESLWSNELRLKLDSHIRGMKENNFRTVSRFLASGSGARSGSAP